MWERQRLPGTHMGPVPFNSPSARVGPLVTQGVRDRHQEAWHCESTTLSLEQDEPSRRSLQQK